jgi:hypothetical protein
MAIKIKNHYNLLCCLANIYCMCCCTEVIKWYSRPQWPRGLRPLAYWEFWLEPRRGHGCLSRVSVVYSQVEFFASG